MAVAIASPVGVAMRAIIADHARRLLGAAPVTPAYRAALAAALSLPGNVLSVAPDARWARLVWVCCAVTGGDKDREDCESRAAPVAAAVEVFMVALDMLDDAEDGEETALQAQLGGALALNVSTGLLFLAQRGLLAAGGEEASACLLAAGLRACAGQHADLTGAAGRCADMGETLAVTAGKSASLVAAICRLGAASGGADARAQVLYARFGWHLGMVAQLINDLNALRPEATGKTDIARDRPTLPLAHAARVAPVAGGAGKEADIGATIWADGPAHLTWAVAETYRARALALIPQMTVDHRAGAALAALLPCL